MTDVKRYYKCKCGAIEATAAAYWRMTSTQQREHRSKVKSCATCKIDSEQGR